MPLEMPIMRSGEKPQANDLYMANVKTGLARKLGVEDQPDIRLWADLLTNDSITGVSLIDRMGLVQMPYNFKLYEPFRMPTDLTGHSLTYEECCQKRAAELLDLSDRLNKPIYVCYSGGIDSTLVVISFLKQRGLAQLKKQLVIVLTPDSIDENPVFYKEYIRDHLPVVSGERLGTYFDGQRIVVGGEHNDQLFGTDIMDKLVKHINIDKAFEPYHRDALIPYMVNYEMPESSANWWYDMFVWHAKQAPCEIKTTFDLLWWFNFCFKWQTVYFRMLLRVDNSLRHLVNHEFVETYFHHFYSTEDFQKWSMLNPQLKIRNNNWKDYKFHAKDVIYNFNRDADYRDNKIKRRSLFKLFIGKDTPDGLSGNFDYLYKLDRADFYIEDNSFKRQYGT